MNLSAAPAWSIKGKKCTIDELNDGHIDSSPGPKYNLFGITTANAKILTFTTGKSQRLQINHGVIPTPDPIQYKPNDPALITHSISFPKSPKYKQENYTADNPAPSAYNPKSNFVKNAFPTFQIGSKYPCFVDNTGNNPGPGDYNNPQTLISSKMSKKSKFGTQQRFSQPNIRMPGVGDYNISSGMLNGKGSLSKSKKFAQIKPKTKPGPGDYKHSDAIQNNLKIDKGKTLGKKFQGCFNTDSETVQAFNNYFKQQSKSLGRTFNIGNQKRQVFKVNKFPAPTDYNIQTTQIFKNGTKVRFAKTIATQRNQAIWNPGPGHYKDHEVKKTQYTIPKSKSISYLNSNPAPGRYNTDHGVGDKYEKYKNQLVGNTIGKSNRTNFVSKNVAGVGDYNILNKKMTGITIPKGNRFQKFNDLPGPGAYHFSSTISNFNSYRKKL